MTPYECYLCHMAMRNHFTVDKFDYFQYNGKLNIKYSTYEKKNDKYFYEKLSRMSDPKVRLLSSLLKDPHRYIGEIVNDEECFLEYKKTIQSLLYTFSEQIKTLTKSDFKFEDQYPNLFKKVLSKEISNEVFILLNEILMFVPSWNKKLKGDIIWDLYIFKLRKYAPFLSVDLYKYKELLSKQFT